MLNGKELGDAIRAALVENKKTPADAARHFGVKPPSVSGWMSTGRISKDKFTQLVRWLDKTPLSHWGLDDFPQLPGNQIETLFAERMAAHGFGIKRLSKEDAPSIPDSILNARGSAYKYIPDFKVSLSDGQTLFVECKLHGQPQSEELWQLQRQPNSQFRLFEVNFAEPNAGIDQFAETLRANNETDRQHPPGWGAFGTANSQSAQLAPRVQEDPAQFAAYTLEAAVQRVAEHLELMEGYDRDTAVSLFTTLASDPSMHSLVAAGLKALKPARGRESSKHQAPAKSTSGTRAA